jgi:hypothetical protein
MFVIADDGETTERVMPYLAAARAHGSTSAAVMLVVKSGKVTFLARLALTVVYFGRIEAR